LRAWRFLAASKGFFVQSLKPLAGTQKSLPFPPASLIIDGLI
jgi:hypothetical protein